ncbi:MAG: transcriptional coactivator p15/PC4 family protein [Planctomycetes bacterium]|nr:transcriptional coactivator p15/PC4 family protein [Planctomycetota bacterium]
MSKNEANELPGVIAATGSKSNRLVAQLSEYEGERLLNLRRWYLDKKTREWMPTKKGLSLTARGYTFLTSVIHEYGGAIADWFGQIGEEGPSGSSAVTRAGETVEASLKGQKFGVERAEWASPESFVVIHQGGAAVVRVNAGTELGRRVLEEYDDSVEAKGRNESGVGLLLSYVVAQSHARALFDGQDKFEAAELLDLHNWNVGLLVNRMVRRNG